MGPASGTRLRAGAPASAASLSHAWARSTSIEYVSTRMPLDGAATRPRACSPGSTVAAGGSGGSASSA